MAYSKDLYKRLRNSGIAHDAALILADPVKSANKSADVTNAAALTAPATLAGTYTQAEVQALRNDVAALQTKLNALLASLRAGGTIG